MSTWYWNAKESTIQGERLPDFHGFSWSYAGPKSNLYPLTEISSMASLTPKLSIKIWLCTNANQGLSHT